MNAPNKDQIWTALIIVVIVSAGGIALANTGYPNPVNDLYVFIADQMAGGAVIPPTGEDFVRVTSTTYKRGAESTYPAATVYVWHDWDNDGMVDIGDINTGAGEIETCSTTDGVFTTYIYYPVNEQIYFQIHASGYQTVEYVRTVPTPAQSWDGVTAIPVGQMPMIATDSSITVTVSEADAGTLVTSSTDYNYTTYGTTAEMTIRVTMGTTDAGLYTPDYTHWVTGKAWKGTFVAITIDEADSGNCVFGDYDGYEDQGAYTYVWWDINSAIFNDADLDDDGSISIEFTITIVGAFDWNNIGIYDTLLMSSFNQQAYGTADGEETDIDFVA